MTIPPPAIRPRGQPPPAAAANEETATALAALWDSPDSMPATQLRVLRTVERHPGISIGRLATQLSALPSSASR